MFQLYRDLIHLRRKTLALNLGDFSRHKVQFSEEGRWIYTDRGNIRTMINFAETTTEFAIEAGSELLLSTGLSPVREKDCVRVPPLSVAIYHWPPRPLEQVPPE